MKLYQSTVELRDDLPKIGLSLSICIKDIAQGDVPLDHVLGIIAGTKIRLDDDAHWEKWCASYTTRGSLWYQMEIECRMVANVPRAERRAR